MTKEEMQQEIDTLTDEVRALREEVEHLGKILDSARRSRNFWSMKYGRLQGEIGEEGVKS